MVFNNNLGQASGVIRINTDDVVRAQSVIEKAAATMASAFADVNAQLAQMRQYGVNFAQASAAVNSTQARSSQQVVQSAAAATQAVNQQASAMQKAAQAAQAQATATQSVVRATQQQTQASAQTSSNRGGAYPLGQRPTTPAFIQFGLFPFAGLAQSLGATGASNALMGAGNVLGIVDAINPLQEGLTRVAERFKNFGGILGTLATTAVAANGTLAGTAAALGTIALVAAPVVLAIAGIAAVLGEMQRRSEEAKKAAEDYLARFGEVNRLIAGGATSSDIQAQIDDRQRQLTGFRQDRSQVEADRAALQAARQRTYETGINLTSPDMSTRTTVEQATQARQDELDLIEQLKVRYGENATSLEALDQILAGNQQSIDSLTADLLFLQGQLGSTGVAANDAAARVRDSQEQALRAANVNADAFRQADRLTARQRKDRIEELQREQQLLQQMMQAPGLSEDAILDLQGQFDDLQTQIAVLGNTAFSTADKLDALRRAQDAIKGVVKTVGDIISALAQYNLENARTSADRALSDLREREDFSRGRLRSLEDFYRSRTQAEADFYEDRTQAQADFREEQAQAEKDFQDRLAKLIRDARISILESAARLDARAVFEQQRRLRQQIANETDEQKKAREQRQKAFDDQLADQLAQFEKQRQRQLAEFQIRLAREDEDRRIRQQRQLEDYRIQDQRRQEDFNNRIQQMIQQNTVMANVLEAGKNTILFIWQALVGGMVSAIPTGGASSGRTLPTPLATGSPRIYGTLPAMLHDGESVLNAPAANSLRRALGASFTMSQAQAFFERGGGGGGVPSVTIENLVLGDIGNRTDGQVIELVKRGMREFHNQYAAKMGALA